MLAFWRFLTVLLTALALTMTSAHVLELPQKMALSPEMYAAVNTTMYRYFAIVGGFYQVGGIVSAVVMTMLLRRRRRLTFLWALAGTGLLILSFVSWLVLVQPVNVQVADALRSTPEAVPMLWQQLRSRWEYGHAVGFVLQLLGFCAIVASVVRDTRVHSGTASAGGPI